MSNVGQPPAQIPIITNSNLSREWLIWFTQIFRALNGPVRMSSYTVSGVPDASVYEGGVIYVSNESGGATLAFSDGTNWRRVQDRAIIT